MKDVPSSKKGLNKMSAKEEVKVIKEAVKNPSVIESSMEIA